MGFMSRPKDHTPYVDFDRATWRGLRKSMPQVLTEDDLAQLRGIGESVDLAEVAEVYLPLSRLIHLQVSARQKLIAATETFLGTGSGHVPFIIGVAGSVAVGKSTTARLLQVLLQRWDSHPRVDLVTTDGFLLPAAELHERRLMARKGFPESYDQRALLRFVTDVKSGRASVDAPVYSHKLYDRVPGEVQTITQPDILIVEGLNVLQPARMPRDGKAIPFVSDFFDFSIYLDADEEDLHRWYVNRFLRLRHTAFRDPKSYFHKYAELDEAAAIATAEGLWNRINLINLRENILPTRQRASLILRKGPSHRIEEVALRRL